MTHKLVDPPSTNSMGPAEYQIPNKYSTLTVVNKTHFDAIWAGAP